jgi:pimeloyl-ACP methyl ester carboxylesterase
MGERIVQAGGVELATEAFGEPENAPVLLVMGAMASMLWWPETFCHRLAGQARFVIRYDNRDTGRSTTWEPGHPGYRFDDMADDTVRIMDAYGLPAAHLVGMSMGGMIAQLAALKHRSRVLTLTVISASPFGEDSSGLPGPARAYDEHAAGFGDVDWSDRAQAIGFLVEESRALAGTAYPFDEAAARSLAEHDHDRADRFASAANHLILEGGDSSSARLGELEVPLLVIHGTADPLFPIAHGIALSRAVPDATLVRLEGGGHELHEAHWDRIIAAIVSHTGHQQSSSRARQ